MILLIVCPPASNFKCVLEQDDVALSWDIAKNIKYTYLPTLFGVYASVGKIILKLNISVFIFICFPIFLSSPEVSIQFHKGISRVVA